MGKKEMRPPLELWLIDETEARRRMYRVPTPYERARWQPMWLLTQGAFLAEYVALTAAARRTEARISFADEAQFQADGDLRWEWVLKGEQALPAFTRPRNDEWVNYHSAVPVATVAVDLTPPSAFDLSMMRLHAGPPPAICADDRCQGHRRGW